MGLIKRFSLALALPNCLFVGQKLETKYWIKNEEHNFKVCTKCGFVWENREDYLADKSVAFIGYQVNFEDLAAGLFLFNHSCQGTFALKVGSFKDLYNGPVFKKRETGSENCPKHCLYKDNLDDCPAECECAFVRDIMQIIKKKNFVKEDDANNNRINIMTKIQGSVVINTVSNSASFTDILEYISQNINFWINKDVIWDLTDFDYENISHDTLRQYIQRSKDFSKHRKDLKTALVARSDLNFGMSRMLGMLGDQTYAFQIEAFRSVSDAKAWLSVKKI